MKRKWTIRLASVCAALCFAMVLQLLAGATEGANEEKLCTLKVNACNAAGQPEMAEELQEEQIVVDLYQVAKGDFAKSAAFQKLAPYDLEIKWDQDDPAWEALAQQAAGIALKGEEKQTPTVAEAPAGEVVSELSPGLYLVIAHSKGDTDYVETVKDDAGKEKLVTRVRGQKHRFRFRPELVAVPGRVGEAAKGEYSYEVEVSLKPGMSDEYGSLEIDKSLLRYENSKPATFIFEIEAVKDGETVYSDMVSFVFTGAGEQSVKVDRIPVGSTVTVTEVYSGRSYVLTDSVLPDPAVIERDNVLHFSFVNDYQGKEPPGGSITNSFTYDGDSWQFSQQYDRADS